MKGVGSTMIIHYQNGGGRIYKASNFLSKGGKRELRDEKRERGSGGGRRDVKMSSSTGQRDDTQDSGEGKGEKV
ncbi:hypothetical protein ACLOJK_003892 [Asimina triloba]